MFITLFLTQIVVLYLFCTSHSYRKQERKICALVHSPLFSFFVSWRQGTSRVPPQGCTMVRDVSRKFDPHVFSHARLLLCIQHLTHFDSPEGAE